MHRAHNVKPRDGFAVFFHTVRYALSSPAHSRRVRVWMRSGSEDIAIAFTASDDVNSLHTARSSKGVHQGNAIAGRKARRQLLAESRTIQHRHHSASTEPHHKR